MDVGEDALERRRTRRWIVAAAAVGLALRLAFGLWYWVGQPLTRDEREYLSLARSLAAGQGFVYDSIVRDGPVQPFGRAPAYPVFLALTGGGRAITETVPTSVKVAQAVVGALGVAMVAGLAGRLAGPRAARIAAVGAACYPPLVWISAYAFSEALFWPLGLVVAWSLDRAVFATSGVPARSFVSGLITGLTVLIRASMLAFVPVVACWGLLRRRYALVLGLALGAGAVLVPWAARNYVHHGRVVLVASEGGVTFWTGNHPLAQGEGDLAANPQLKVAQQALRAEHPDLTEEQMEPVYYREAFAWIRQHPVDWLALEARKLFYVIVPIGPSYTLHSTRYLAASLISYGVLLPFAVVGFVRLGPRRQRTPGLWLLAVSAVVVSLAFFPQERFRLPVLDPTLIICAASLAAPRRTAVRP